MATTKQRIASYKTITSPGAVYIMVEIQSSKVLVYSIIMLSAMLTFLRHFYVPSPTLLDCAIFIADKGGPLTTGTKKCFYTSTEALHTYTTQSSQPLPVSPSTSVFLGGCGIVAWMTSNGGSQTWCDASSYQPSGGYGSALVTPQCLLCCWKECCCCWRMHVSQASSTTCHTWCYRETNSSWRPPSTPIYVWLLWKNMAQTTKIWLYGSCKHHYGASV